MRKIFTLISLMISISTFAQHTSLQKEVNSQGIISFLRFNADSLKRPTSHVMQVLNETLNMRQQDELRLKESQEDELGYTHQLYLQFYKGIKVEYAAYGVHSKKGKIEYIGGEFEAVGDVDIRPTLTEKQALKQVLQYINAQSYKWQNPDEEILLKELTGNPDTSYYPEGELVICKDRYLTDSLFRLAYKFNIYAELPLSRKIYYVDAINGKLLYANPLIKHVNATGTAATRYSSSRSIVTDSYSGGFRLRETRNGTRIETYNMNMGSNYGAATDFTDNNNNWTAAEHDNADKDNAALDAHWGSEKVYDYFKTVHARNSWNGSGGALLNYVHANLRDFNLNNNDNAFWDGQRMTYGDGESTMDAVTSLDVIAHEIGHGVMQDEADLAYERESGALNEGFSDIWAACVEAYSAPEKDQWLIGEDIMLFASALRSMSNPNSGLRPQPDTYGGTHWENPNCGTPSPANDYCGVHTNSGVLNYWFYLVAQGNSGTNDIGDPYCVQGIGITKAARIAYRALSIQLKSHPNATFANARTSTIQATIDIFGYNSNEVAQVTNAWYAVGVGNSYNYTIGGPENLCSSEVYTITPIPAGATVTWTANPQYRVDITPNGTSATIEKNTSGYVEITATVMLCSGQQITITRTIDVGAPLPTDPEIEEISMECDPVSENSAMGLFEVAHMDETIAYHWSVYPESDAYIWEPASEPYVYIEFFEPGYYTVSLYVETTCGDSFYNDLEIEVPNCQFNYVIYPNPSQDYIKISKAFTSNMDIQGKRSTIKDDWAYHYKLYDDRMRLWREGNSDKNGDTQIDVKNMPANKYFIHIIEGARTVKKQVLVID